MAPLAFTHFPRRISRFKQKNTRDIFVKKKKEAINLFQFILNSTQYHNGKNVSSVLNDWFRLRCKWQRRSLDDESVLVGYVSVGDLNALWTGVRVCSFFDWDVVTVRTQFQETAFRYLNSVGGYVAKKCWKVRCKSI